MPSSAPCMHAHPLARCLLLSALVLFGAAACETEAPNKSLVHGNDCATCHVDDFDATKSPPHAEAQFSNDCEGCHVQTKWQPAMYVHTTVFPLSAGHAGVECAACHTKSYAPGMIPNKCVDCHAANAAMVPSPIHAGLSTDCFACHRTDGFKPARFVHSWPLEGVHATQECVACHTGKPALYEGTSTACIDCHGDDRARADANVTGHAMYPTTCQECHGFDAF